MSEDELNTYHDCSSSMKWYGLYSSDAEYQRYVDPITNKHPAKMSLALADKVMTHIEQLGLLNQGDRIIDFMCGTARTGVVAALHGHPFIGVELEDHFIDLINGYVCDGQVKSRISIKVYGLCRSGKKHASHWVLSGGICESEELHTTGYLYGKCKGLDHPHAQHMIGGNYQALATAMNRPPDWTIIQGDARYLSDILNGGAGITSPPYSEATNGGGIFTKGYDGPKHTPTDLVGQRTYAAKNHNFSEQNIGNLRDAGFISPAYADMGVFDRTQVGDTFKTVGAKNGVKKGYSDNPDNIGNLQDVNVAGMFSPPYSEAHESLDREKNGILTKNRSDLIQYSYAKGIASSDENNIGNLKDAGIVSPSYANRMDGGKDLEQNNVIPYDTRNRNDSDRTSWPTQRDSTNIGNLVEGVNHRAERETYLDAMYKVYHEAYTAGISPLVTVTKNPTRDGQLRRLDLDTAELLERCGYKIVDYHQAMLFTEGVQQKLAGDEFRQAHGRLGFFKRLQYQKGNMVADHEDIIIAVIPERQK